MTAHRSPQAGAVGMVLAGATGRDSARAAVLAAFRSGGATPDVLADGPLVLAWATAPDRTAHLTGRTVCLLDGVLYDLPELRRATNADGPPAAVLAAGHAQLGEEMLQSLRGDFWALLWDRRTHQGLLVGDQMGGRSPFWFQRGADLVFASELPELLAALPYRPGPDPVAMAHWLSLHIAPEGRSLFEGVRRLPAGHLLPLGHGAGTPRRYWAPRYQPPAGRTRPEIVRQLGHALRRAVDRRLADASHPSMLLSGGLDSSVVVSLAAAGGTRLATYSATFPGHPRLDEAHLIDITTSHLGLHSTRVVVRGGSVIEGAARYLQAWQVPPTTPNLFFWLPLLERAGADGVDVMLDGEGGDELFGLSPYLLADRLRHGRLLSAIKLAGKFPGSDHPRRAKRVWRLLRKYGRAAAPPAVNRIRRTLRDPDHVAPSWFRPETARWRAQTEPSYAWKRLGGPRWWAGLVHGVMLGVGPALVYEQSRRRAAMGGVQARHPLVDVDVIELMLGVPPELAFDSTASRPLLRETVAGLLPDAVRLRPAKSSFDTVFHAALAGPDLPSVRRLLGADDAEIGAYVDLGAIRRQLLEPGPPSGRGELQRWATTVWRLLTAECWLRGEADGTFLAELSDREGLERVDCELTTLQPP